MSKIEVQIIKGLLEFFNGDEAKVSAWMTTPNVNFGYIAPEQLIKVGRGHRVLQFIENAREENLP